MTRHRNLLLVCFFVALCSAIAPDAKAQKKVRAVASATVPSPNSVLGFTPGTDRTIADWTQITNYFKRLDQASNRVLVQAIGQSTLKRPIIAAFISARENILALNKYKEIQRKLADPRTVANDLERDRLIASGRVVVAISCSIHSTEIVASQMSMQLAYDFATAQDADTEEILKNTILILIPSANPDGVDIVANWYRKTLGTPYEGREPPELYHHFAGHDDNRDWFMLNLKETQNLTRLLWKEWFPQIVYDVHQQGSNGSRFFVPPFFDPHNPNIAPLLLRQVALLGHKMAADLQAAGFKGVITNSLYDTWWHGGFRTAPYFHNAIGILSEAASARLMSPATVTQEQLARSTNTRGLRTPLDAATNFPDPWPGGQWKPSEILNMEIIAARSLLSLAAKYRSSYLRDFYNLGQKNITQTVGANEPIAYLIPAGQGRDENVAKLTAALIGQGIELFRLDRELHAVYGPQVLQRTNSASERLGTYRKIISASTMHEVPAGSYIIFLAQPQRSNVLTLFEPQIYPDRLNAQGEAERPYDVAGWTLPMQMGVEAPATIAIQETPAERKLTLINDENQVRQDLALPLKKGEVSPIISPIKQPLRVGIYKGWTSNMDEGWTRFIFETFNVPYTSIRDSDVRQGSLSSNYDVIVIPSQREREIIEGNSTENYPREFTGGMTMNGIANLKSFVESGGALLCFDASCEMVIKQFNLPLRNVLEGLKSSEFYCPGSILSVEVDNAQPLARGIPHNTYAYFINSSAFESTDPKVRVVARYAKQDVLRSGWLLGEDKLRGKIALAEVPFGRGRVVLFAFRPQHRGQAWGTLPFIWNAITGGTQ